jgi:deoxycytidylate deaminase/dephospho-CoA kinase
MLCLLIFIFLHNRGHTRNMAKIIIGLTGSLGSGCTTTAKHLGDEGYDYISISSDLLAPLAKKHNKPFNSVEEKQDFGNVVRRELREEYKKDFLKTVAERGDKVAIECFRNPLEVDFLRDEYPHFYLISLFSPKHARRERKKIKESDFDKLDKRDEGEEEKLGQQVRRCVNSADIVLDNSVKWSTMDDAKLFFDKVDEFIRLLEEPYRRPNEKELLMHLAYSVSLRSNCIERQVGAVVSDERYRVISTGYNDVPQNSESCYDLYSECYRKIKKKKNILALDSFKHCLSCGTELTGQADLLEGQDKADSFKCPKCGINLLKVIPGRDLDYCRSLHAEENAILSNPYLSDHDNKRFVIFSTTFPCMLCAKKIANSGITRVIFVEPYPVQEAYDILGDNEVVVEAFEGVKSLSFNWIFRRRSKYLKETAYRRRKDLNILLKGE